MDILFLSPADWDGVPGRFHHIARRLARHNRVLYVDGIGMRPIDFTLSDAARVGRRLVNVLSGHRARGNGTSAVRPPTMDRLAPIVLPFKRRRLIDQLNRALLCRSIGRSLRQHHFHDPLVWIAYPHPDIVPILQRLSRGPVIYDCVDDWNEFAGLHTGFAAAELALFRMADLVLATAPALLARASDHNAACFLVANGVDHEFFATERSGECLRDIEVIPPPRIGFVGNIAQWVDLSLIEAVARCQPTWQFVLVGPWQRKEAQPRLPNLHWPGKQPYAAVPAYLRSFDVAIIAFNVDNLTRSVDPLKILRVPRGREADRLDTLAGRVTGPRRTRALGHNATGIRGGDRGSLDGEHARCRGRPQGGGPTAFLGPANCTDCRSGAAASQSELDAAGCAVRGLRFILSDVARGSAKIPQSDEAHLSATMAWLARAQDAAGDGVSARYSLLRGWDAAYPETTGYIIPTFMRYAALAARRAVSRTGAAHDRLGADGSASIGRDPRTHRPRKRPDRLRHGAGDLRSRELVPLQADARIAYAAKRAGEWLISVQDRDGAWRRHEYRGLAHAYASRVSWALLTLAQLLGEPRFAVAAQRNLAWILEARAADGWIEHMGFDAQSAPFTHTIAYTLEGMWESARYVGAELAGTLRQAVRAALRPIVDIIGKASGAMPGRLARGWQIAGPAQCLTGNAQLASILMRAATDDNGCSLTDAARALLASVKRAQIIADAPPGILGGVAGSAPIWGPYLRFQYPNWAAKFFADALMQAMAAERPCHDTELWRKAEG